MRPILIFIALACFVLSNSSAQVKTTKTSKSNQSIYNSLTYKGKPKPKPKDYIKIVYERTTDSLYEVWHDTFKGQKFLEQMAGTINKVFKITKPFTLSLRDCGMVNAFYSSQKKELILCYDMLQYLYNFYKDSIPDQDELGARIGKVLTFIYFHEVGHALIDLLDIPVTGKEEDAADYFSFYFLASNEVPEGVEATMDGANFFLESYNRMITDTAYLQLKKEGKEPQLPFWDEHSLDMQRFYSIACLIYGSNPDKYDFFIEKGFLGARRPGIAISEFKKIKKSWDKVLGPHIKYTN